MATVAFLPVRGEVFLDLRGEGRALRVSWHWPKGSDRVVILSLWRGGTCTGSFRLPAEQVPALVDALVGGLAAGGQEA